jgi:hypothetical protein
MLHPFNSFHGISNSLNCVTNKKEVISMDQVLYSALIQELTPLDRKCCVPVFSFNLDNSQINEDVLEMIDIYIQYMSPSKSGDKAKTRQNLNQLLGCFMEIKGRVRTHSLQVRTGQQFRRENHRIGIEAFQAIVQLREVRQGQDRNQESRERVQNVQSKDQRRRRRGRRERRGKRERRQGKL